MSKERIYSIKINGLEQSISQVDALNQQLEQLEQRIEALSQKTLNVTAKMDVASVEMPQAETSRRVSDLSEEAKLQKEINATLEKAAKARSEEYQQLLSAKEELKEYQTIAKSVHAQENLLMNKNDLQTMAGMKAELRDIKQAMQTMDVDSDGFKLLVSQASELTEKLKKLESEYGTFGRNVGNYQSAFGAQEFQTLKVNVNGVAREFASAREALRTLTNERNTLKLMGQDVGDLDKVVKTLQSDLNDMSKSSAGMDMLLDTMEGIIAIASTAKGLGSLFGFDESKIQRTVQQLLGLQNALKGVETIRKQMQTGEGIGGLFSKGNDAIDQFTKNLFRVRTASAEATVATKAQAQAVSGVAAANTVASTTTKTLATNTTTLTTAQKAATIAAQALGVALKALGIGLIIAGITHLMSIYDKWVEDTKKVSVSQDDLKKSLSGITQTTVEAETKIKLWQERLSTFNGTQDQAKKLTEAFNRELGNEIGKVKSLTEAQKNLNEVGAAYIKVLQLQAKAEVYKQLYIKQSVAAIETGQADLKNFENALERTMSESFGKVSFMVYGASQLIWGSLAKRREKAKAAADSQAKAYWDEFQKVYKEAEEEAKKAGILDYADDTDDKNTKATKAEIDERKKLNELRISVMKEGWAKIQAQLNEELRQRIDEIRYSSLKISKEEKKQLIERTQELYADKIANAYKEYTKSQQKAFDDMWNAINERGREGLEQELDYIRQAREAAEEEFRRNPIVINDKSQAIPAKPTYGLSTKGYSEQTRRELELAVGGEEISPELIDATKEYVRLQQSILAITQRLDAAQTNLQAKREEYAKANDAEKDSLYRYIQQLEEEERTYTESVFEAYNALERFYQANSKFRKEGEMLQDTFDGVAKKLSSFADNGEIDKIFENRLTYFKSYYAQLSAISSRYIEEEKEKQEELLTANYDNDQKKENKSFDEWKDAQEKALAQGLITQEQYEAAEIEMTKKHKAKLEQLEKKYEQDIKKIDTDAKNKRIKSLQDQYNAEIDEYNKFLNAIQELSKATPKYTNVAGFQFIDIKSSKKEDKKIISYYEKLFKEIQNSRADALNSFTSGKIDREAYDKIIEDFDRVQEGIGQSIDEIKNKMANYAHELSMELNNVLQMFAQSISDFLNVLWDAQDATYRHQLESLQTHIDEVKKLLDAQEEMTRGYAERVNDIEGELADSRGDRRQELIDEINAQMAAQRASLAEEKRIEREKKKMEAQAEKMEQEQKKKEQKRAIITAVINGALAVSNALTTSPFIPAGIIAAALAAALSAAQIALISKQKYAQGGMLEGRRHSQGGIPVGNTGIEVEGQEYIIRRETALKNVPLLNYVNESKKKLTLDDFVDFYGGKPQKIKQNLRSTTKFADGGIMATIPSPAISAEDRIIAAMERYAERPYYVSVTEINDVSDRVGRVQVIAGQD